MVVQDSPANYLIDAAAVVLQSANFGLGTKPHRDMTLRTTVRLGGMQRGGNEAQNWSMVCTAWQEHKDWISSVRHGLASVCTQHESVVYTSGCQGGAQ